MMVDELLNIDTRSARTVGGTVDDTIPGTVYTIEGRPNEADTAKRTFVAVIRWCCDRR